MPRLACPLFFALIVIPGLLLHSSSLSARPLLRCAVTYAGTTQMVEQRLLHDVNTEAQADTGAAYTQEATDIAGRFLFKAILLGQAQTLKVIKIYVYYQTENRPVLVQETRLLAPLHRSSTPDGLTGMQYLHAGVLERELQYGCALLEEKP